MTKNKEKLPLNATALKAIACITMLIDHIGAVFFPTIRLFRIVGRIAMPIYCFMLTEGALHTRSKKKYIGRMALSALIAEIPFDMSFRGRFLELGYQNVLFTLTCGLICVFAAEYFKISKLKKFWFIPTLAVTVLACFVTEILQSDYGLIGVVMVMSFYLFKEKPILLGISLFTVCTIVYMLRTHILHLPIEAFAVFALIPIFLYNGKKGLSGKAEKIFFYAFYPVHLLIIGVIYRLI